MKKCFFFAVCILGLQSGFAQKQTGFKMSSDIFVGYSDKQATTMLGYDVGYKPLRYLYIGAGPLISGSFGSGKSNFSAGGYAKIRVTAPLKNDRIVPFIDFRGGYSYSFSNSNGGGIYGVGVGLRFSKKFFVGLFCNMNTTKTETQKKYISGYTTVVWPDGSRHQKPIYKKKTVTDSKTHYIPSLMFGIEF